MAALSLLGVAHMLGRRSWAALVGGMLVLVWLAAFLFFALYSSLRPPEPNLTGAQPYAFLVLVHASFWLGSAAVLPLALGALFVARKRRLGVVLLVLSVPGMLLVLLFVPQVGADISLSEITALIGPLSFPGAGVGVPEAVLWVSLGVLLLGEARLRALSKLRQSIARENEQKARRLYEEGLVGSLLNRYIYIERMSFPNGIKQRLQLWRWGHLRPRLPKAPQHYPRVQPSSYSP